MKPSIFQNLIKLKLLFILAVYGVSGGEAFAADYATVLMYHRFGEDKYPSTNIRIEQFKAHLDILDNGDYTIWPLGKIVDHLQQGLDLPDRTVAITIDDAYRSVFTEARPLQSTRLSLHGICCHQPVDRGHGGYELGSDPDITRRRRTNR